MMRHPEKLLVLLVIALCGLAASACSPKFYMFPDYNDPLQEMTLSGEGKVKILVVPVSGVISDRPHRGLLSSSPSVVQEVVSALDKARKDKEIKAVILRIDSPGGSVTASDILHREILRFKEETGLPVLTLMMDLAASGGYYMAMASDYIIAHPSTVTGSIGVIFYTINIEGLFEKIGVGAEPIKSGTYKDMGSPFRGLSEEERLILQEMIDEMYTGFVQAIVDGRPALDEEKVRALGDGRIYTAKQALQHKLIDAIGYAPDAISKAQEMAGVTEARIIVYRRNKAHNDNIYNPNTARSPGVSSLIDLGITRYTLVPHTGFYYIWEPGVSGRSD